MFNRVKSLYSLYTAAEPQRRSPGARCPGASEKKKKKSSESPSRHTTQACRLLRRLVVRGLEDTFLSLAGFYLLCR